MRIAVGGIAVECCTFSPILTRIEDFKLWHGQQLLDRYGFLSSFPNIDWVPLIHARSVPGGSVQRSAYDRLKGELIEGLKRNGPWDGVYLELHGAMHVEEMVDAETDLVREIRDVVGSKPLIAASLDLHGNLSERLVVEVDLLTGYRTAPHTDIAETCRRACEILIFCLRNKIRPRKAFVRIPMLLPGEFAMTSVDPGKSIYAKIPQIIGANIIDASVFVGFAWADEPRSGASVVLLGLNVDSMRNTGIPFADELWSKRKEFRPGSYTGSIDECISIARGASESPVFISDSGDNVTAGGIGDSTKMLEKLLAGSGMQTLFAPLYDPSAVQACFAAGSGAVVDLTLGGTHDPVKAEPFPVSGKVLQLLERGIGEREVLLHVGDVDVVLTERRTAFTTEKQFNDLGVQVGQYKAVVVKLGYLFPDLRRIAAQALIALSPGVVPLDIHLLNYRNVRRPIYPLDAEMEWSASSSFQVGQP